jgi:hypothetical protein
MRSSLPLPRVVPRAAAAASQGTCCQRPSCSRCWTCWPPAHQQQRRSAATWWQVGPSVCASFVCVCADGLRTVQQNVLCHVKRESRGVCGLFCCSTDCALFRCVVFVVSSTRPTPPQQSALAVWRCCTLLRCWCSCVVVWAVALSRRVAWWWVLSSTWWWTGLTHWMTCSRWVGHGSGVLQNGQGCVLHWFVGSQLGFCRFVWSAVCADTGLTHWVSCLKWVLGRAGTLGMPARGFRRSRVGGFRGAGQTTPACVNQFLLLHLVVD